MEMQNKIDKTGNNVSKKNINNKKKFFFIPVELQKKMCNNGMRNFMKREKIALTFRSFIYLFTNL